ncbi:MAG: tetrathionate reductase family octaheme c-type cytochrome [candidate division Zixibacteria bacterium]|nr:tetrathionate reductase family octaheme c-type cytochrome [candidate division Zixibacteria bacterium]
MSQKNSLLLFIMLMLISGLVPQSWGVTADHGKFPILKQEFKTGPEVTRACLSCHTESAKQVHKTIHWTWVCPKSFDPQLGKSIVVNNFCIALPSNEPRCTSCHAGYGWRDSTFDFTSEENVDCLVCHDQTGEYQKFPTGAGHPAYEVKTFGGKKYFPPDFNKIARNVGKPSRHNCGVCHFYGGGGEGVKHADLDESLENPRRELDVHMARDGLNYQCIDCHRSRDHEIAGRCYSVPAAERREFALPKDSGLRIACESCHSAAPHENNDKLNDHTDRVACQTCHIPYAAREKATKHWWDWSKAGEFDENGEMIVKKDEHGNITYHTMKGEFAWSKNMIPEYYWFNGGANHTLVTDKVDPAKPVEINSLKGDEDDPDSRIYPVKVHRGKQVYDPVNETLIIPKLFGPKGSGAYWKDFDWVKSAEKGMEYVGLPFSGEVGFVETAMYWPITHMVAPKEHALKCNECHAENGRLASLGGFYMPGRDDFAALDIIGWVMVGLTFLGVLGHGLLRLTFNNRHDDIDDSEDKNE